MQLSATLDLAHSIIQSLQVYSFSAAESPKNSKLQVLKIQFLFVYVWPVVYILCSNWKITSMILIKHLLCLFSLLNYFIHTLSRQTSSSI